MTSAATVDLNSDCGEQRASERELLNASLAHLKAGSDLQLPAADGRTTCWHCPEAEVTVLFRRAC